MLMSPNVRRHAVMLAKIPIGARVNVRLVVATTGDYKKDHEWYFAGVDEQDNVARFSSDERLPLDRLLTVYQMSNGSWCILSDFLA